MKTPRSSRKNESDLGEKIIMKRVLFTLQTTTFMLAITWAQLEYLGM